VRQTSCWIELSPPGDPTRPATRRRWIVGALYKCSDSAQAVARRVDFVAGAFPHEVASNVQLVPLMVKAFAASGLVLTVVFGGGLAAVACSSPAESTFSPDPPKPDAEDSSTGSLIPDGGGPGDGSEGGPSSCAPAIPATFAPSWTAPVKKAACTDAELKAYFDACVADPGKTEGDGTCKKFKTDNPECSACAEPDDNTGPVQWNLNRKYQTLNTAGCIAVAQGAPEVGKCGEAYNAAVQCGRQSCEFCFGLGGTFTQFQDCQKLAGGTGICKSYENAKTAPCVDYRKAGSPALVCFNDGGTETKEVHWSRVIGLLCGGK